LTLQKKTNISSFPLKISQYESSSLFAKKFPLKIQKQQMHRKPEKHKNAQTQPKNPKISPKSEIPV
jgi:hypothetical protein